MTTPAPLASYERQTQMEMIDIKDLISFVSPQAVNMANMNWLRSCYEIVYGSTNVFIERADGEINVDRPVSQSNIEDAQQVLGTPDILTWGCWLTISRFITEHARDAFAFNQPAHPVWNAPMISVA